MTSCLIWFNIPYFTFIVIILVIGINWFLCGLRGGGKAMRTSQALKKFLRVSKTIEKQWCHLPQLLYLTPVRSRSCNTSAETGWGKTGSTTKGDVKLKSVSRFETHGRSFWVFLARRNNPPLQVLKESWNTCITPGVLRWSIRNHPRHRNKNQPNGVWGQLPPSFHSLSALGCRKECRGLPNKDSSVFYPFVLL